MKARPPPQPLSLRLDRRGYLRWRAGFFCEAGGQANDNRIRHACGNLPWALRSSRRESGFVCGPRKSHLSPGGRGRCAAPGEGDSACGPVRLVCCAPPAPSPSHRLRGGPLPLPQGERGMKAPPPPPLSLRLDRRVYLRRRARVASEAGGQANDHRIRHASGNLPWALRSSRRESGCVSFEDNHLSPGGRGRCAAPGEGDSACGTVRQACWAPPPLTLPPLTRRAPPSPARGEGDESSAPSTAVPPA